MVVPGAIVSVPPADDRPDLRAMTLDDAEAFAVALGWPRFRGEQIWRWVHGKGAAPFDEMTNLVADGARAARRAASIGTLDRRRGPDLARRHRASCASSRATATSIESVLIPDGDKTTQCISSQVGCAVDCQFCATAKLGLKRNLDAGEIVDQVYLARAAPRRGRARPPHHEHRLHGHGRAAAQLRQPDARRSASSRNDKGAKLSQRRITVSTSGLVPKLEKLGTETVRPNLAVSLNAPNDAIRDEIMPINRKWNIGKLLAALGLSARAAPPRSRSSTCCSPASTTRSATPPQLARLLRGIKCKVNIIPYNPHPEAEYQRPSAAARSTRSRTSASGSACRPTCARPRGDDIDAACGQLANRSNGELLVPLRRGVRGKIISPPAPPLD